MLASVPPRSVLFAILLVSGSLKGDSLADLALTREENNLPAVEANDNRKPAGTLRNDTLRIDLEVQMARWYPGAPDGPYIDVAALAEKGYAPQVPAPLIRVPAGTTILATVHNTLSDSVIWMRGLETRPGRPDSVPVKPGETREFNFNSGEPGTYVYAGTPGVIDYTTRLHEREQLSGALIVDSPGGRTDDRVFVINVWGEEADSDTYRNALAINGKSWPYTERLTSTVGDTLRWRVINGSARNHPMHLHGFYFRVDTRGSMWRDTLYTPEQRRMGVTEDMSPGNTMLLTIAPTRAGNWLFHCHLTFHVTAGANLPQSAHAEHVGHSADPNVHMAGLVLGIRVNPAPGAVAEVRANARQLRLYVQEGNRRGLAPRAFGYVLQRGKKPPARDSVEIPGSVIVVTRDEPTDITVVNRLKESTAVHWHGIELESYSDGVPGWSGIEKRLAPMIAPGDSFTARLTLPRAGTFIYHTHLNDIEQITSGLYGAIVVLEPGETFDPKHDHVYVAGWDGRVDFPRNPTIVINGDSASGPPLELAVGVPQRFRFINIGPASRLFFSIRKDTAVVQWRALAKDGATLPAARAVMRPASQRLAVGEMFDAEFTPREKGEYVLAAGLPETRTKFRQKLIVR
ncbi:MAG: multicopper oxidase domain-containing protein [Gemmatimonadales bacterium]